MKPENSIIRRAGRADLSTVEKIVRDAYSHYIQRIGKAPGPMLDDYAALIDAGVIHLLDQDGQIPALIVLLPKPDHLLLDNVAVRPEWQGHGFGRRLIDHAVVEAQRLRLPELRLYTHQKMVENIALYQKLGFVETSRRMEAGYDRVFMTKTVNDLT